MKARVDQFADLKPSGFDYLLTAVSGGLTAFAAGMSVANQTAGIIFVILSLLGVWISFSISRTFQSPKVASVSGFVYTAGVVAAFLCARPLCAMIPENPFVAQIFICGALCWMLVFGSFLIWSDQTLLFQAVPSIAIFGLVGCYDTYRDGTWMFFGFLLCFATTLARVHTRTMLRQAKDSGYSQSGDRLDRSATELERMRSGPWKWAAGPQWALGSAFVVILFSFVGAPIIRQSVQVVAGNVRVQAPAFSPNRAPIPGSGNESASLRVGQGPNELSSMPLFRATLDEPRYMRTGIYQSYSKAGWNALASQPVGDKADAVFQRSMERTSITAIKKRKTIDFAIEPLTARLTTIPSPGEVIGMTPPNNVVVNMDGTLVTEKPDSSNLFRGQSIVQDESLKPNEAVRELPAGMEVLTNTQEIAPTVFDLANRASAGGKTDFERAQLIKQAIEKRVKYNLSAEATPAGADPVEHFLFTSKEGYCDLFASSMTVMARSVGIPARMVVGYYPFEMETDENGRFIIKESDKHAWSELFFKDVGWVIFDATEGAEAVPGSERGSSTVSPFAQSGALQKILDAFIGLGVIGIVAFSIWGVWRSIKSAPNRTDLDREYLRFADVLAKASGKARNFDQTPSEYVNFAIPHLNGASESALGLTARFERLMYSQQTPTREELNHLKKDVAAFRAQVKAGRSKVA